MTPQVFEKRVDHWRVKLAPAGLSHWHFEFEYPDGVIEDNYDGEADACVRVHQTYDNARWEVGRAVFSMTEDEVDKLIVHELLHVMMRDLNRVERDMLSEIGGRPAAILEERLDCAIEQFVERTARAIVAASVVVVL